MLIQEEMTARDYFPVGMKNNFRLFFSSLMISAITHGLIAMIVVYSPIRPLDKKIIPVPITVSLVSGSLPYGQCPEKEKAAVNTPKNLCPQKPAENVSKTTPDVKIAEIIKPAARVAHKKKKFKTSQVIKKKPKEKEKALADSRADAPSKTSEPLSERPGQNQSEEMRITADTSAGTGISGGGGGNGGGGYPNGSRIYGTGDIDHPLKVLNRAAPVYPMYARRMGLEGAVEVRLLVCEKGFVKNVDIIRSEPKGVFDKTVIQSLSSWRFSPGTVAGVPVKAYVTTTIRFNLENE